MGHSKKVKALFINLNGYRVYIIISKKNNERFVFNQSIQSSLQLLEQPSLQSRSTHGSAMHVKES